MCRQKCYEKKGQDFERVRKDEEYNIKEAT